MSVKKNTMGVTSVEISEQKDGTFLIVTFGLVKDKRAQLASKRVGANDLATSFTYLTGLWTRPQKQK
jgi:hypothetical protein